MSNHIRERQRRRRRAARPGTARLHGLGAPGGVRASRNHQQQRQPFKGPERTNQPSARQLSDWTTPDTSYDISTRLRRSVHKHSGIRHYGTAPMVFNGTDAPRVGQMLLDKLSHPSMQMIHVFEIMGAYFFIFAVLWNIPYLGRLLDPLKLIVVAFHEFSHAIVGKCTGAKIESIEVNPDQGGATRLRGGNACLVLPAGYIGSSIFGSLLVFCSFDLLACKISAGIVAFALLCTL
ncbi:hypothetical protein AMAG_11232 [Allomyces macrogynus ATCC 38327]|uniref:Uncharacterized protein n=1 Tax=Allomyces macrogynus (strain ATCC 38327) TaxID=578462 RepID=A0A0L0SWG9_ALLM3|nr:hypothetical protein AMAG_11232 [Allomyces macrogynus ATCC 38327]|eukprot:KNE66735.1 hypothetical protein AMAG_11232 [Allomyces macrogynus ATCC 38327]